MFLFPTFFFHARYLCRWYIIESNLFNSHWSRSSLKYFLDSLVQFGSLVASHKRNLESATRKPDFQQAKAPSGCRFGVSKLGSKMEYIWYLKPKKSMETIFETHPYLYVLLDPKNPWKNEGFYTPNKREKHSKNEGNVGSYGVAWINHWNSQRFTGAGAIYLSRHGISTLPVLMAWCGDGLKKPRCFFDTSRVCTKLMGYNFIILY